MHTLLFGLLALGPADVRWTDLSGLCSSDQGQQRLEEAVERLADGTVTVVVRGQEGALEAELTIETSVGSDTRTMRSPACDTLIEASALIAASSVADPGSIPAPPAEEPIESEPALAEPSELEPPPAATNAEVASDRAPKPRPEVTLSTEESAATPPGARPPWDLWLRLSGHAGYGFTPRFGGGGAIAAGAGQQGWRVEATAAVFAPTVSADRPGVSVWGWGAGARGCGVWRAETSRVRPVACLGAEIGQLRGQGIGALNDPRAHVDVWATVTAGPGLRVSALPWLQLALDVEAVVGARRPGFAIAGLQEVHRPAIVTPRVSAGLEFHVPRGG